MTYDLERVSVMPNQTDRSRGTGVKTVLSLLQQASLKALFWDFIHKNESDCTLTAKQRICGAK